MKITKKMLEDEIKVLHKAAKLHTKYSISQYKQVLDTLYKLEEEKKLLEKKVQIRTSHLENEIAQKENLTNKLQQLAQYDQLTKLANRYLFLSELELVHKEAELLKKPFSLLFIDLDGFKLINDTYGHEIGDALLIEVAKRIQKIVRKDDMVARLGGDEFTVILRNLNSYVKLKYIAEMLISSIQEPFFIDDLEIYVGASIGIYRYNNDKEDLYSEIISKADIAMYEAKKAGKGRYIFFDESMQKELQEHTSMKHKIKNAFVEQKFINHFQPIVSSKDYKIIGAEVLLRFKDQKKLIFPEVFISILEEDIHLIQEVTYWQITTAIELAKKDNIFYSINLSAKLLNYDLIQMLEELLEEKQFDPSSIYFEVTETSLLENISLASKILVKIQKMGFNFSLDDFGTGYSSLAYLKELSFDTLKIDKKFIDDANQSVRNKKLLQSIINMAKVLEMKIVLEGIETKEQLTLVKKSQRIKLQGFYFYRPLPQNEFLQVLSKQK
ncbi:MAG: EAL domain-containing protein [Epsilonproteobacteria bacterium]|nr:EAL domain-containing protein [Campylobacterota bacterium]